MPDGGASVSMDTSAPKPWLAGADPLLRSTDGTLTEPWMGWLEAVGGIDMGVEGDDKVNLDAYIHETSLF